MNYQDNKIAIEDLDCIYLTYDEPQMEEFWLKIKQIVPWAKRVHGVHGSDAAHKAAAEASSTDRFILIDGDNLPDPDFFSKELTLDERNHSAQFRWRARNYINGLYYGNGGISCWTKDFVKSMRTHENTDGSHTTNIEFCFHPNYWPMHDCYSTTYVNYTPKQAWRAGFREGVKMCTRNGVVPPSRSGFLKHLWPRNLKNLSIWHTIGQDVENGWWAIYGARLGTHYLMLRDWDYTCVRDFKELDKLWDIHCGDGVDHSVAIADELNHHLGLDIVELNGRQSLFFKKYISNNWHNRGIMVKEIDIIRQEEGW